AVGVDLFLHYDGTTWTSVTPPPAGVFSAGTWQALWGTSASDIWAAGINGAMAHYNGTTWTAVSDGGNHVFSLWGTSSSDVYAVGGLNNGAAANMMHYNGTSW